MRYEEVVVAVRHSLSRDIINLRSDFSPLFSPRAPVFTPFFVTQFLLNRGRRGQSEHFTQYAMGNGYPNPSNPSTTIRYDLPRLSHVSLKIYPLIGPEVRTMVYDVQGAHCYRISWDGLNWQGSTIASGVYFYRFSAEPLEKGGMPYSMAKKMIVLKYGRDPLLDRRRAPACWPGLFVFFKLQ